ncbi:MAG TPA: hypothetical protein VGQ59_22065, partial [Cyclobacteriaceae bacterium]|nr:hypothetical protein [Cyclobacteriaceae bacterium]
VLLRPSYQNEIKSEATILLTKSYQSTKVDSIVQKNPELKIIRTIEAVPYPNSSILKSWYDLSEENISFIIGQGLPSHALELIHIKAFQFTPAPLPRGVIKLIIPNDIYVNDQRQIQGTFNGKEKTKLKLVGPGGVEDSVTLGKGEISFSLTFAPKQSGKFIYSLVAEASSTSTEQLPIEVLPERHLRILFIQKFPTAEVRFLKNFLSEKNHEVILRYQTSKSNFDYEYSNAPRMQIDGLRSNLLSSFDLLFIDQKSYAALSSYEKSDLSKSIRNGLGVIFFIGDAKDKAVNEFLHIKAKADSKDTVHIHLSSSHDYVLPVSSLEWQNDVSVIAATKNKSRVLSGYSFSGEGKIGVQFIQETYRLGMQGNVRDYSSLWTTLISNTARAEESNFKLKLTMPFPYYSNEPIDISAISSGLQPALYSDSIQISMKENASVEDYWTGRSWAGKPGWHRLHIAQDSTQLNYFVSDTSEWRALKVANQMMDNKLSQKIPVSNVKNLSEQKPVSLFLFYFIFLFSSAFLWLAPKIS